MAKGNKGDTRPIEAAESYDDLLGDFVGSNDPEAQEFQAPAEEIDASEDISGLEAEMSEVEEEENVETSDEETEPSDDDETHDEEVAAKEDSEEEVKEVLPDIDYVMADGKKVKVDFSNRDQIKKAYSMAAGARKWQANVDKLTAKFDDLQERYDKKESVMNTLEAVKDDPKELYRILTGGGDLDDYVAERIAEQDKISLMSPEQLDVYNNGLEHQKRVKEIEKREAAIERQRVKNEESATSADNERQTALVHKAFLDNGFDGQLGDADLEHEENDALWHTAIRKLSKYEDGVDVELINKTFKEVADHTRRVRKYNQTKTEKQEVKKQVKQATKAAAKAAFKPKQKSGIEELEGMSTEDALMSIFS